MPKAIADLAHNFLTDPVKVEVTPPGKAADKIEQYVHFVAGKNDKTERLKTALAENPDGRAIVFLRTKHGAEKLYKHLDHIGFKVASIHGNKSQGQRERALKGFKDGEIRVLVATDVAARGIDIPAVTHVFNYDLPEVPDAYVHRIGRTARAGRDGVAIAFCTPDEGHLLRDIERLMNIEIAVASGERPEGLAGPSRAAKRGGAQRSRNARPQGERIEGERARGERNARGHREDGHRHDHGGHRPAGLRGGRHAGGNATAEPDNDLEVTSDFKRVKILETQPGKPDGNRGHRGGPKRPSGNAERPLSPRAEQPRASRPRGESRPSGNGGRSRKGG